MLLDTLIVGAGQAGLATAYHLNRRGIRPVLLEAGPSPTGSWPRFYDSLTLFSPARHSTLPGRSFDGDPGRYPTLDKVVAYLAAYAGDVDADIHLDTRVDRVAWRDGVFEATAGDGRTFTARRIVSATGGFARPHRPNLPGLSTFARPVLHSAD